jgi:hypothetical protein
MSGIMLTPEALAEEAVQALNKMKLNTTSMAKLTHVSYKLLNRQHFREGHETNLAEWLNAGWRIESTCGTGSTMTVVLVRGQ